MKTRLLIATALSAALAAGCAATRDAYEDVVESGDEAAEDVRNSELWTSIEENWNDFRAAASERWNELTEDDLDDIDGDREELVEDVQEYYGVSREEAEEQVDAWAVTTS